MRNFTKAKRIVIKIGTNTLSKNSGIDSAYIRNIAKQIADLIKNKKQVLIVSSGAIGMGAGQIDHKEKVMGIKMRQACAAIGQPLLMQEYRKAFARYNITVAQVLLTAEVLNNRKTYLNLKNALESLLKLGVVPILNENDSVATEEIKSAFGDNDSLSALIASKIDADLLIMLSDIDGLYDKDPRKFKDAKPIPAVFEITEKIMHSAGKSGSKHATGGMKTKLIAAQIASNAGCRLILTNGRQKDVLKNILAGEEIGTIFMPKRKLSNRTRWILNSTPAGTIYIDAGAEKAIKSKKSLLPTGVTDVKDNFQAGAVIMINDIAKAVTAFSSSELKMLAGKKSEEIKKMLGSDSRHIIARPENIVLLDY